MERSRLPLQGVDLAEIAALWNVDSATTPAVPDAGAVNQTVPLRANCGRSVLRGYRHLERGPVEREHAVSAHVRANGLSAVAPLPLPGGHTIHSMPIAPAG